MAIRSFACVLLSAAWTVAQPPEGDENRSHVKVPALGGNEDPAKLFQKRWQLAKGLEELRRKHPNLLTPERMKELGERFKGIDLSDPKLRAQLESLLRKQHPGLRLTPEQIEALERLIKEAFPQGTVPSMGPPSGVELPSKPDETPKPAPSEKLPGPANPEERERQAEAQAEAARQLTQFARGLERLADNLNDSPALRQTLQDLGTMALRHAAERPNGSPGDLNAWLARANRLSGDGDNWLARNWPNLRSLDFPRMSMPRLPALSWRRPAVPGLPSGGAVGVGSWKSLVTFVLVAALIVALARLLRRSLGKRGDTAGEDDWQLGAWPVNPAEVRTRADLVRTFEYFSLLRLGRRVRTWNHRKIEHRLVNERSTETGAVRAMAALYEKARYAPADEPLSEEALEAYRRDLCALAGAGP